MTLGVLGILSCVAAYLWIGFAYVAPRWVTREVEQSLRDFAILAEMPGKVQQWRREAAAFSVPIALIWPVYLAYRLLLDWISGAAPLTSHELKLKAEQQALYIALLERECETLREAAQ